ncbi:hypothetical protein SteCoe_22959 [Stentor coeruleus]|uniref:Uncharacterized protein n=1 Tax=Stentor coeruleus TaxID=5963 RepID=A0A1R2BL50_9CILI|nr:hypothetical protein SteCoe_22959 [Stentor coeruleus]
MGCCYCFTTEKEFNFIGLDLADRIVEHVQKSSETNAGLENITQDLVMTTKTPDDRSKINSPIEYPVFMMSLPDNSSEISVMSWKKENFKEGVSDVC